MVVRFLKLGLELLPTEATALYHTFNTQFVNVLILPGNMLCELSM